MLKAASALRQARLAGGGADDAVVPTSSATLARGLHRRVDPLALYASRQGLPEKYSPSSGIHTISHTTHESAPAVCIACCVPLHSGARRPACMQHKQTAHRCRSSRCGQSQHRPASAWACAVRGRRDNSGLWYSSSAPSNNSQAEVSGRDSRTLMRAARRHRECGATIVGIASHALK